MKYTNIRKAKFISRPNRFIAMIEIDGAVVECHVKNTGRCKELLIPGQTIIYVQDHGAHTTRKTRYSLINVIKHTKRKDLLINMDSQAPNKVAKEWLERGGLGKNITYIKPEQTYGDSRFDLYFEYLDENEQTRKAYMEVKGVTLEEEGIVRFPDAPTERGVKHINELVKAKQEGYDAYLLFVIQMEEFQEFYANDKTDPAFAEALENAKRQGVTVLTKSCEVTIDTLRIK